MRVGVNTADHQRINYKFKKMFYLFLLLCFLITTCSSDKSYSGEIINLT